MQVPNSKMNVLILGADSSGKSTIANALFDINEPENFNGYRVLNQG